MMKMITCFDLPQGTKWTATKWIHPMPYSYSYDPLAMAGTCRDMSTGCSARARAGECDVEGSGMVGPGGLCRRACKDCKDCKPGDKACAHMNMDGLRKLSEIRK